MIAKPKRYLNEPVRRTEGAPVISRDCPMVRNRATWCMGLCKPHHGIGACGEPAPHATLGKTQLAILRYKKRAEQEKMTA